MSLQHNEKSEGCGHCYSVAMLVTEFWKYAGQDLKRQKDGKLIYTNCICTSAH